MTPDEIMEVVEKLSQPEAIIQETERVKERLVDGEKEIVPAADAFVVFVTLDSGKECVAVIEFDSEIDSDYIVKDGHGDEYHTTITVFEPDVTRKGEPFDYLEYLVLKDTNYELDIIEESSQTETAYGEMLTAETEKELSAGRVTQQKPKVKREEWVSVFDLPFNEQVEAMAQGRYDNETKRVRVNKPTRIDTEKANSQAVEKTETRKSKFSADDLSAMEEEELEMRQSVLNDQILFTDNCGNYDEADINFDIIYMIIYEKN